MLTQRVAVDLGVDRGGQHLPVAEDLPDLLKPRARPEHPRRRGVPQPVRVNLAEPGASAAATPRPASPAGRQPMMRRADAHEQRPVLRARRPTVAQIRDDRLADIDREAAAAPSAGPCPTITQLPRAPIDVLRTRSAATSPARSPSREQHVKTAKSRRPSARPAVTRPRERLQLLGLKRSRQPG